MINYCLSNNDVNTLQAYVFVQKIEACGSLEDINNVNGVIELKIDDSSIVQGKSVLVNGQLRDICFHPPTDYIFHTHSYNLLSYPSIEDITRIIDEEIIKVSIIATRWGIYVIKRLKEGFKEYLKNTNTYEGYCDWVKITLDEFGRYEVWNGYPNKFPTVDMSLVKRQLNNLNDSSKYLYYSFYKWDDIIKQEVKEPVEKKFKRKLKS